MGTKNNPGSYDCHAAAEPDEPMFVLLARDPIAPLLVRNWVHMRMQQIVQGIKPNTPEQMAKISEALKCADEMDLFWRRKNGVVTITEATAMNEKVNGTRPN